MTARWVQRRSQIGTAVRTSTSPAAAPSQIWYSATGLEAAHTLGAALGGPISYVPDPSLTGNTVALLVAGSQLTVSTTTTTTTTPTVPGQSTTTTTIPSDVYTNTQPEPWNPSPCTLGAATQASPTTSG